MKRVALLLSLILCHAVYFNVMQFTAMSCSILQYDVVSHGIVQVLRSAALLEAGTSWRRRASWTRRRGRGGRGKAGQEYSPVAMSGPLVTILIEDFHTDRIISAETVPH